MTTADLLVLVLLCTFVGCVFTTVMRNHYDRLWHPTPAPRKLWGYIRTGIMVVGIVTSFVVLIWPALQ